MGTKEDLIRKWQHHPLASLVPGAMTPEEFAALKRDIERNGQRQPIVLFQGKLLDGRHRLRACAALGIAPKCRVFEGTEKEAEAFVISENLHRKTITAMQKALLAVRMIDQHGMTYDDAAAQYGISQKSISLVRKVMDTRITPLIKALEEGEFARFVDLEDALLERTAPPEDTVAPEEETDKNKKKPKLKPSAGKPKPKERPRSTDANKVRSRFVKLAEADRIAFVEIAWPHLKGAIIQAKNPDGRGSVVDELVRLREEWKRRPRTKKSKSAKTKSRPKSKKAVVAPATRTLH